MSLPLKPRCCSASRGLQLLKAALPTSVSWVVSLQQPWPTQTRPIQQWRHTLLACPLALLGTAGEGTRGTGSGVCHLMERGLGLCTGCAHSTRRALPDQGSRTLFWSLRSLLPLQPNEDFVPLKSKFLTFQIILSSPHSQLSALNEFSAVKRKKKLIALYKGKVRPGINTKERGQTFWL